VKHDIIFCALKPKTIEVWNNEGTMMRIMHILPELEEGGVERHVLMLSAQQIDEGNEVYVVSAGGKLVAQLSSGIVHLFLPVHRKNPITGIYCAVRLSLMVKENKIDVIHAHSRVPAWVAMFTSKFSGKPYVVTAHAYFSTQSKWIYVPYRKANTVICVSNSVQSSMKNCFAENTVVIRNGMPAIKNKWKGSEGSSVRFLFIGRLTKLKGLQDIIKILPAVQGNLKLDILGDGPLRQELEEMIKMLSLEEKVTFHGFRDDPDTWMERSDCLLFPPYIEGMPLTLARAIQIGIPVIASDIEPVSEMALENKGLIKPGDLESWKNTMERFLVTRQSPAAFDKNAIPSILQMTQKVLAVYQSAILPQEMSH
jgi:glycosyltransferase involved in cell wall biosynthesis